MRTEKQSEGAAVAIDQLIPRLDELHAKATKGKHDAVTLHNGKWVVKVYHSTVAHFLPWEITESTFRAPDADARFHAELVNAYPALRDLAMIGLAAKELHRIEGTMSELDGDAWYEANKRRFHAAKLLRQLCEKGGEK